MGEPIDCMGYSALHHAILKTCAFNLNVPELKGYIAFHCMQLSGANEIIFEGQRLAKVEFEYRLKRMRAFIKELL